MRDCWFSWGGDGLLQLLSPPLRPGDCRVPQVSHESSCILSLNREQNQERKYCIEEHLRIPPPPPPPVTSLSSTGAHDWENDRPLLYASPMVKTTYKSEIKSITSFSSLPPPPHKDQFHNGIDSHKEMILWNRCWGSLKF